MNTENIEAIEQALQKEFLELVRRAKETSELFWEHRKGMLEVRTKGAFPLLGCKIVSTDTTLRMTWHYWSFYKTNNQTKRTNVHISKPKSSHHYNLKKLYAKALPNEYDAVEHCEKRFADIRKESETLRKVRQSFYYYKQCWYSGYFAEKKTAVPVAEMDSGSTIVEVPKIQKEFGADD